MEAVRITGRIIPDVLHIVLRAETAADQLIRREFRIFQLIFYNTNIIVLTMNFIRDIIQLLEISNTKRYHSGARPDDIPWPNLHKGRDAEAYRHPAFCIMKGGIKVRFCSVPASDTEDNRNFQKSAFS